MDKSALLSHLDLIPYREGHSGDRLTLVIHLLSAQIVRGFEFWTACAKSVMIFHRRKLGSLKSAKLGSCWWWWPSFVFPFKIFPIYIILAAPSVSRKLFVRFRTVFDHLGITVHGRLARDVRRDFSRRLKDERPGAVFRQHDASAIFKRTLQISVSFDDALPLRCRCASPG